MISDKKGSKKGLVESKRSRFEIKRSKCLILKVKRGLVESKRSRFEIKRSKCLILKVIER